MDPKNVISNAKRFIGRDYDAIVSELERYPFKCVRGNEGEIQIFCPTSERRFSPEEVKTNGLYEWDDWIRCQVSFSDVFLNLQNALYKLLSIELCENMRRFS